MLNKEEVKKFKKELESLLNRYGLDTACKTPNFILADYLEKCLQNYHSATLQNISWHKDWNVKAEAFLEEK